MKINNNFVLRQVAQSWIVLPLAEQNENLKGMLTLTDSGAILWKFLEQGCELSDLAKALTDEYEVTQEKALADATNFVNKLVQLGCVNNP